MSVESKTRRKKKNKKNFSSHTQAIAQSKEEILLSSHSSSPSLSLVEEINLFPTLHCDSGVRKLGRAMIAPNKKFIFGILSGLFIANILAFTAIYSLSRRNFLEVNFLDVGQGDATLIQTPQQHQILIDGGPTSIILEKLSNEMPFWDRTIDLIILTHPENDHMAGLLEVLKRYKVENILWTGIVRDTAEFQEWQKLIKEEEKNGARIKIAQSGQKINLQRASLFILYPFENLEGKILKDSNNTSIVNKLIFGKNSFLFSGDIYKTVEKEILESGADINSDVLKVSHHGSKTSSDEEFIKKVSPDMVVISVGKDNKYGHPHQEVLETLTKYDINVLRTDKNGDIRIKSDGINYVSNF